MSSGRSLYRYCLVKCMKKIKLDVFGGLECSERLKICSDWFVWIFYIPLVSENFPQLHLNSELHHFQVGPAEIWSKYRILEPQTMSPALQMLQKCWAKPIHVLGYHSVPYLGKFLLIGNSFDNYPYHCFCRFMQLLINSMEINDIQLIELRIKI